METIVISHPEQGSSTSAGKFKGYSANTPEDLAPGQFTALDNVIWDNGTLRSRPGLRAQLTTPLGQIGSGLTFVGYDGVAYAIFVAGGATTAGIYTWAQDAAAATLISGAVNFNRDSVQFAICGNYIFITGATTGVLYRYSWRPAFLFESAAGLTKPAYALTTSTTNSTFKTLTTSANWLYDKPSAAITFPDDHWQSGDAPDTIGTNVDWDSLGGVHDLQTLDATNNPGGLPIYLRFDEPQSSIILHTPITIPAKANAHYTSTALSTRHSLRFLFQMTIKTDRSQESVRVALIGYDGAGNRVAQTDFQEYTSRYPGVGASGKLDVVGKIFSFANQVDDNGIAKVGVIINAGTRNTGGANGPYISYFVLTPLGPDVQVVTNTVGGVSTLSFSAAHCADYLNIPTDAIPDYFPFGRERLSMVLPGATDFSNLSAIAIPFFQSVPFGTFPVKLGLRVGTAGLPVYTDTLERYDAIDGTYLVADLSVIPAASRTGITHIELVFQADIPMPPGYSNVVAYFTIGDLLNAGRLTADLTYAYRVREYSVDGGGNAIVSPATDITATILPSRVKAQGKVVVGSGTMPANTSALLEFYRDGGTDESGLDKLVARFATGADTSGATWTWTDATRTFVDNTPDLLLIGASVLEDHDATPLNLSSLATFAGRLVGSIADALHLSQASSGRATGLYWTNVYNSDATNAASSGQVINISGEGGFAGGDVVALAPYKSRLTVLMPQSLYVLLGDRPPFALRRYETDSYYGAVSFRSVFVQATEMCFLAPDGLRSYNEEGSPLLSGDIEQALNPFALLNGAPLDPAAYRLSFVSGQAQRLFLSAPVAGGANISVLYVYDRRANVWTRWLTGNITGCLRFATGDKVYFTGANGQIYRLGPEWGDTTTRAGSAVAVPVTLTSRAVIYPERRFELRAQRYSIELGCADAAPAYTFLVTAEGDATAKRWSRSFAPGTGRRQIPGSHGQPLKVTSNVRGASLQLGLTASTINPVTLYRWMLTACAGKGL